MTLLKQIDAHVCDVDAWQLYSLISSQLCVYVPSLQAHYAELF